MATIDNTLKQKLEHLLAMSGGYVLDYSNASFEDFVRNSIGVNPYEVQNGSKAQVLRHLWFTLSSADFAKLTIDMLEYRRLGEDLGRIVPSSAERAEIDRRLGEEVVEQLRPLLEPSDRLTPEEVTFLARDLGTLDLTQVDVPVNFQTVIADRLVEVDACFENGASLAVVILCGARSRGCCTKSPRTTPPSTTERQPPHTTTEESAPSRSGR